MDFNLPEELQRRICFALIPAKTLCWPPKLSHYRHLQQLDEAVRHHLEHGRVLAERESNEHTRQESREDLVEEFNFGNVITSHLLQAKADPKELHLQGRH
jgi:hypothetical protein